ncbi:MAG: hypothetical protein H7333_03650 [Bdellovibrionales bacterium]|nr:hypothetical protein [Oligoflexia bacterium]
MQNLPRFQKIIVLLPMVSSFVLTGCFEQDFGVKKLVSTSALTASQPPQGNDNASTPVASPTPILQFTPVPVSTPFSTATPAPTATATPAPTATPNPTATPPTVCDPLGGGAAGTTAKNGIKAQMFYFEEADLAKHPHDNVMDYFSFGTKSAADFFFKNLYVPTRAFSQGFTLSDGKTLLKADGTPLIEYFSFKFKSELRLPKGSTAKKMQFALVADDGANLLVQNPVTKVWSTSVGNDGVHGTIMKCSVSGVDLNADTSVPIEVQYFQGPRYHIALTLLWREWKDDGSDAQCNRGGNSYFFDSSTVPSTPTAAWTDVLSRWQVVPADSFTIGSDEVNPCK